MSEVVTGEVETVDPDEKPDMFKGIPDEVLQDASNAFHGITKGETIELKGGLKDPETISDERYLESLSEHPGLEVWIKKRLKPKYTYALEELRTVDEKDLKRAQGKADALSEFIKSLEFNRKTSMLFNEEKMR